MKYSKEQVKEKVEQELGYFIDIKLTSHDFWEDLFCEDDYDMPEHCWTDAENFLEKVNNLKVTVIVEEK